MAKEETAMIMTTEKVKYIRAKYPAGTRVECICM